MQAASLPFLARRILIPGYIALAVGACSYSHEKDRAALPDPSARNGERVAADVPSFAEVREQVLEPQCAKCHHHEKHYEDYAKTFANRDEIRNRVFLTTDPKRRMPKRGALTAEESDLLKRWLDADAPEEAQTASTP